MARDSGPAGAELAGDLAGGMLAVGEQFDDSLPGGVGERGERVQRRSPPTVAPKRSSLGAQKPK